MSKIEKDEHRFVVVRRGVDQAGPFEEGDAVTTYELVEPWPFAALPAHSGMHRDVDEYAAAVRKYANRNEHWAVKRTLRCDCRSQRAIAYLVMHLPSERLWVTMRNERVPTWGHRVDGWDDNQGWPLHGRPSEAPHMGGVTTCNGCHCSWIVYSFPDSAGAVKIKNVAHGARVRA